MSNPTYPLNKIPTYVGTNNIPITQTVVTPATTWLHSARFVNPTKKVIMITVTDGSGVLFCSSLLVNANDSVYMTGPAYMVNGISWFASDVGLHGRLRYST